MKDTSHTGERIAVPVTRHTDLLISRSIFYCSCSRETATNVTLFHATFIPDRDKMFSRQKALER